MTIRPQVCAYPPARPCTKRALTSSLVVDNLNYSVLQATSGLLTALEAALKVAIAGGVGNGITPGSVDVNLHACSLVVHASVLPPTSAALDSSKTNLDFSDALLRKVAADIRGLEGIEAAFACGTAINVRRAPPWAVEAAGRRGEEVKACVDSIFQKAKEKTRSKLQECPSVSVPSGLNQLPEPPLAVAVAADSAQQLQRLVASDSGRSPKPRIPRLVSTMEQQDIDALGCCWQLQGVRCNGAWAPRDVQRRGEPGEVQSRGQTSQLKVAEDASLAQQRVKELLTWAGSCGQLDTTLATMRATVPRLSSSTGDATSAGPANSGEPSFTSLMHPTAAANVVVETDATNTQAARVAEAAAVLGTECTPSAAHQRQQRSVREQRHLHNLTGNGTAAEMTVRQKMLMGEANMAALPPVPSRSFADIATITFHPTPKATFAISTSLEPAAEQHTAGLRAHAKTTTSTPRSLGSDRPSGTKDDANAQGGANGAKTTTRYSLVKGEANMAALPPVPSSTCTEVAEATAHATQQPAGTAGLPAHARRTRSTPRSLGLRAAGAGHRQSGVAISQRRANPAAAILPADVLPLCNQHSLEAPAPVRVAGDTDAKFQFCQGRLGRVGDSLRVEHLRLRRSRG